MSSFVDADPFQVTIPSALATLVLDILARLGLAEQWRAVSNRLGLSKAIPDPIARAVEAFLRALGALGQGEVADDASFCAVVAS